jgi:6,7-dimethyl-8-ribityllumazine synthase
VSDRLDEIEARLTELGATRPPSDGSPSPADAENSVSETERPAPETEQEPQEPKLRPPEPEPAPQEPEPAAQEPEPAPREPEPAPQEPELAPQEPEHVSGELRVPEGYTVLSGSVDGPRAIAVVVSKFNAEITNALLERALAELDEVGVPRDAVMIVPVPGAFELPLAAMALAKTRRYACIVALGCVIRGETPHFDYVAGEAASGLQLAAIETGVPVSFGVLTVENREQAEARVERAADAVRSALEMADVFSQLRAQAAGPLR